MTWCDPTRLPDLSTVAERGWKSPKWRLYGKIMDDQKNSFSIAMFDSERYLSWWSTFLGFWRFGVALQMLILLPKAILSLILNPKTSAEPRQTLAPVWQTADVQKRSGGDGAAWLEMSLRSRLGRRVASGGWDHISLGSPLMVSAASPRVFKLMT